MFQDWPSHSDIFEGTLVEEERTIETRYSKQRRKVKECSGKDRGGGPVGTLSRGHGILPNDEVDGVTLKRFPSAVRASFEWKGGFAEHMHLLLNVAEISVCHNTERPRHRRGPESGSPEKSCRLRRPRPGFGQRCARVVLGTEKHSGGAGTRPSNDTTEPHVHQCSLSGVSYIKAAGGRWDRRRPWGGGRPWPRRHPWERRLPRETNAIAAAHGIAKFMRSPEPMRSPHPMRTLQHMTLVGMGSLQGPSGVDLGRCRVDLRSTWGRSVGSIWGSFSALDLDLGSRFEFDPGSTRSVGSLPKPRPLYTPVHTARACRPGPGDARTIGVPRPAVLVGRAAGMSGRYAPEESEKARARRRNASHDEDRWKMDCRWAIMAWGHGVGRELVLSARRAEAHLGLAFLGLPGPHMLDRIRKSQTRRTRWQISDRSLLQDKCAPLLPAMSDSRTDAEGENCNCSRVCSTSANDDTGSSTSTGASTRHTWSTPSTRPRRHRGWSCLRDRAVFAEHS